MCVCVCVCRRVVGVLGPRPTRERGGALENSTAAGVTGSGSVATPGPTLVSLHAEPMAEASIHSDNYIIIHRIKCIVLWDDYQFQFYFTA